MYLLEKKDFLFELFGFFLFILLSADAVPFLFLSLTLISNLCLPKGREIKGFKRCVTVAVWKMLLISFQRMDLFHFSLLLKLRKNLEWRIEVYFRLFTVTFPVTPFVRYVKVVGCELSREYVSLFPTTSKTTVRETASHCRMTLTNARTVSCKFQSPGVLWNFICLRLCHRSYCPFMLQLMQGGNCPNRVT